MIKIIFIFLLVLTTYENSKVLADDIERVDEFIEFLDIYNLKIDQIAQKITSKKESKEAQLKKLFTRLTSNKVDIVAMINSIRADCILKVTIFENYINKVAITGQIKVVLIKMQKVFDDYITFYALIKARKDMNEKKIKVKTIKKSIDTVCRKEKIDDELKNIYKMIIKSEVLDNLLESIKNFNEKELCGIQASPQELFFSFYIGCLSLEVLAITTMMNGNGVYKIIEPKNGFDNELADHIDQCKKRLKEYSTKFLSILEKFPKNYRNCDPFDKDQHQRDVTYTEMTGLYQRILLYSFEMLKGLPCLFCQAAYFTNGIDAKQCYSKLEGSSTPWDKNGIPEDLEKCTTPRNCLGTVTRCRPLKNPEFCLLTNSTRRYQWLRDLDENIDDNQFGYRDFCYGLTQSFIEETRYNCSYQYCFCTCGDESPNSLAVNTVSLLPSLSNTLKNRIVVGARIIVQDYTLHVQVREAKIDKNYKIAKDGPDRWIKIDDIHEAVKESRLGNNGSKLHEFEDYIAWKENRTGFNFDEILVPYGRVVTGLKFGMSNEEGAKLIRIKKVQIEVQSMEYNYKTGQLVKDSQKWHASNKIHSKLLETGTKVSTMTNEKTIIDSNTDQWSRLQVSHDRSDAGQTTVPLFDAQTIESFNKSPLGGIGFHHRTSDDNFAGFFALTGYSIDYYQFLKETNKNLN